MTQAHDQDVATRRELATLRRQHEQLRAVVELARGILVALNIAEWVSDTERHSAITALSAALDATPASETQSLTPNPCAQLRAAARDVVEFLEWPETNIDGCPDEFANPKGRKLWRALRAALDATTAEPVCETFDADATYARVGSCARRSTRTRRMRVSAATAKGASVAMASGCCCWCHSPRSERK